VTKSFKFKQQGKHNQIVETEFRSMQSYESNKQESKLEDNKHTHSDWLKINP